MNAKIPLLPVLLLSMLTSVAVAEPAAPTGRIASLNQCVRRNGIGYWNFPAALNQYHASCAVRLFCPGRRPGNFQYKQIATYGTIPQWLWQGSSTATFSIAQQNAIMTNANNLANANLPAGKFVYSISYFDDFLVGPSGYFIGGNVTYAQCISLPQ